MASLYDTRGREDSGSMSMALYYDDNKNIVYEHNARPRVGVAMRVGAATARSYSSQDWWQTTLIEEIVSETEEEVVFKTVNGSTYTWRA